MENDHSIFTVTRKFPVSFNGWKERLKRNFYSLGYYCTPNLSIHQNSTQELTWNFLVTLAKLERAHFFKVRSFRITVWSLLYINQNKKNYGLSWYYLQLKKSSMIYGFPAIFVLCRFSAIDFFLVALRKAAKLEIRGTKHISQGKFQLLPLEKQWNFSAQYWKLKQSWLWIVYPRTSYVRYLPRLICKVKEVPSLKVSFSYHVSPWKSKSNWIFD